MNVKEFYFDDQLIRIDLRDGQNLMVNATEMASVFKKLVEDFTRLESTKKFIASCLKPHFAEKLQVNDESDLIVKVQKSGTWMHRVLALKFAGWLNSDIDVWIHIVTNELLNGFAKIQSDSVKETIKLQNEKKTLEAKPDKSGLDFERYLVVCGLLKNERGIRTKTTKKLFIETANLFNQDGADSSSYHNA